MGGGVVTGIKSYESGYLSKLAVTGIFISAGVILVRTITPASVHHPLIDLVVIRRLV